MLNENMFTGVKDVDRFILLKIDSEKDLARTFQVNKYFNSFFFEDRFWIDRFFDRYGKHLGNTDVSKYQKNKKWRKYYYEVTKAVLSHFPYMVSAIYKDSEKRNRRYDILNIMKNALKIKHVKKVCIDYGSIEEEYFTRDGEIDGVREGFGFAEQIIDIGQEYRWDRFYRNGFIMTETYIENKVLKTLKDFYPYNGNNILKKIQYSVKGEVLQEEDYLDDGESDSKNIRIVKKYFSNGSPKAEGILLDDKKQGDWTFWNKNGVKTVKTYHKDRLKKI